MIAKKCHTQPRTANTRFSAFLTCYNFSGSAGGGYSRLDNFGKGRFSHKRTRTADKISQGASFLCLNGRSESSSFRAEHLTASKKYRFNSQNKVISIRLNDYISVTEPVEVTGNAFCASNSFTATNKHKFGAQEDIIHEFYEVKLGKQGFALRHKYKFGATNSLPTLNKHEFGATNSFPALNKHKFVATNPLPALNKYEFGAPNSLTALNKYEFGATNSLPALNKYKFVATNSFTATNTHKFCAQDNVIREFSSQKVLRVFEENSLSSPKGLRRKQGFALRRNNRRVCGGKITNKKGYFMKEIQTLYVSGMNNGAHFTFISNMAERAEKDASVSEKCKAQVAALREAVKAEDENLQISAKSLTTDKIAEADRLRDQLYAGYKRAVGGYTNFPVESLADAAKILQQHIKDYKIDVQAQLDKETGLLVNFIQDLEGKFAAQVKELSLGAFVEKLKAANETVRSLTGQRTDERSAKTAGALKAARAVSDEAYRMLVLHVNAHALLEGEAAYAAFIDYANTEIEHFRKEVLGGAKKAKSKADGAEE